MSDPIYTAHDPEDLRSGDSDGPYTIRLMTEADVDLVTALGAKQSGQRNREYYAAKIDRCVREPAINTSLLAEQDGVAVGFLFGRLFFGEFGIPATRAVLDTLGVHPDFQHHGIAHRLLEQYAKNLSGLRVEAIDTLVDWDRFDLLSFFKSMGFRPSRDVDLVWDVARYPFAGPESAVVVRQAEEVDLGTITAVDQEVVGQSRSSYFVAKWKAACSRPDDHRLLVAEWQGEPAGFLVAALYRGEFGIDTGRGVIDSLSVRQRFQHHGVASTLVQHLLGWLEARSVTQMETLCRWNDWELLRFFEYVGFRPSARVNLEWRFA